MISVYEYNDYREIFILVFEEAKQNKLYPSLAEIAKHCGIQPSYLTNVIKRRAHFSNDQSFEILTYLGYSTEDIEFVLLLMEEERTGSQKRKVVLENKIRKMKQLKLRSDNYIDAKAAPTQITLENMNYYLDPFSAIIHMYFGIKNKSENLDSLANNLGISRQRLTQIIQNLTKSGHLEFKQGKYHQQSQQIHLNKESPLSKVHQLLIRNLSTAHLSKSDNDDHFAFSVTFNADEDSRQKIQLEFLKYIKRCQAFTNSVEAKNILQMNFDLFPWDI